MDNVNYADFEYANKPITLRDVVEGTAQLVTSGAVETTDLVSAIHKEIIMTPFPKITQNHVQHAYEGTIGRLYAMIKGIMRLSGNSTSKSIKIINTKVLTKRKTPPLPFNGNALICMINGSIGDTLYKTDNPMALPMLVYDYRSRVHDLHNLRGNIVLFVHGLCMTHKYWKPTDHDGLGYKLKQKDPYAKILYLEYNSGRRISNNGEMLSALLTKMVANNPHITSIKMIGHSMGGLVIRSAMFYGGRHNACWLDKMTHYVAIASPHQGAMLERFSHLVQEQLAQVPYVGHFARLVNLRSAGILDLRYGSVRHQDWKQFGDRIGIADDMRHPCFLPDNVKCFLVASSMSDDFVPSLSHNISDGTKAITDVIGDGLVSVESALGQHERDEYNLNVPDNHKKVFYNSDHMSILHLKDMHDQLFTWFGL